MNKTFWTKNVDAKSYDALTKDVTADVAVIGGGIAGLMCAYELNLRGHSVCVLEAGKIGGGETAGSSAMVTFAHDIIYQRLVKKHGVETAQRYLNEQKKGLAKIKEIASKLEIEAEEKSFVLYSTTECGSKKLVREKETYDILGAEAEFTGTAEMPFKALKAMEIKRQLCLEPYAFAEALAKSLHGAGVMIFENTRVREEPHNGTIKVNGVEVRAKYFVVATHFPYINVPGLYFAKMYQSRSHNVIYKGNIDKMYESAEDDGLEFRPAREYALCGGAAVRTGKYKHLSRYKLLEKKLSDLLGESAEIVSEFSAQDCMTADLLPFAGRYGYNTDNLFVVTGFNKWGFTNSAACAEAVADCIEGKKNVNIFDPSRFYFVKAPLSSLKNIGAELAEFINLPFSVDAKKLERIGKGQGAVIRLKGKRIGVYKDENGRIDAVIAVCPHLGCGLKWNKDEASWDCPCHGSRFDTQGRLLGGPSVHDAVKTDIKHDENI